MRLTTVFNMLLALQGACVRSVELLSELSTIVVGVTKVTRRHRCPQCKFSTRARYDQDESEWRHVSLGKWKVLLRSTVARLSCPEHGVITEAVPWAAAQSRFTLDFEELVAWMAREMSKTAATELAKVAWRTVGSIVQRVVGRKLDQKRMDDLYFIGLDEVSYRKGHKYLTVVADHIEGDAIWAGEGRTQETVGKFFDELGPQRCSKLLAVTMDMSASFIAAVQARIPQATICFDPFHVVKLANEAVQTVRRTEARERKGTTHADVLKGSRWALLRAPEDLSDDEQLRLCDVALLNHRVYRAYLLKEELRALYWCAPSTAAVHLEAWLRWASRSRLAPFVRLARTLRAHIHGVLAAIQLGLSNGRLEGLNTRISMLRHRAYGFHSAAALIAMIYLCCSHIPISLPV